MADCQFYRRDDKYGDKRCDHSDRQEKALQEVVLTRLLAMCIG